LPALLADMIDDCIDRAKALRAWKEYERAGRYWKELFPNRTLGEIVPGDIERYMAKRISEVAPATVNRSLSFLRRVFNVAIADGLAESNPVRGIKFFKENNTRVRFLRPEEEAQLAAELQPDDWALVEVALNTGLRRGEQFGLRWEHIDFGTGLLTVPRSNHGGSRRVPMNDTVRGHPPGALQPPEESLGVPQRNWRDSAGRQELHEPRFRSGRPKGGPR
jgi:integrase